MPDMRHQNVNNREGEVMRVPKGQTSKRYISGKIEGSLPGVADFVVKTERHSFE